MAERHFTVRQMIHIVWVIGWSDFFLKYRGSVLGYVWSFLAPLLRFLVILYVFQPLLGPNVPQYPLFLFLGLILWDFFCNVTTGCMWMVLDKQSILSQIAFPRLLLILGVGWTNTVIFLTHFLIFCVFGWFYGITPNLNFLLIGIVIVQMLLLALGIGMVLCSYSLKFQDIRHLWEVTLQIFFWLTPITYTSLIGAPIARASMQYFVDHISISSKVFVDIFIQIQPIALLIFDARRIVLHQGNPSVVHTAILTGLCGTFFFFGYRIFRRRSMYFLDEY